MGDSAEREVVDRALLLYTLAAVIALYFVLQARLESWRLSALLWVLQLLPLAGAALGAVILGRSTSVLSLTGGLAVLVVAVRGGLLLIEHCQRLERDEGLALGPALVQRAAAERFDHVILSVTGSVLVLLPLLFFETAAGLEIIKPMAAMVVGGLLAAALCNLFVLPSLYLRFARPAAARDEIGAQHARFAKP